MPVKQERARWWPLFVCILCYYSILNLSADIHKMFPDVSHHSGRWCMTTKNNSPKLKHKGYFVACNKNLGYCVGMFVSSKYLTIVNDDLLPSVFISH